MQKTYQIKHKLNQKDSKHIPNQTQTESKRFNRHTKPNTNYIKQIQKTYQIKHKLNQKNSNDIPN